MFHVISQKLLGYLQEKNPAMEKEFSRNSVVSRHRELQRYLLDSPESPDTVWEASPNKGPPFPAPMARLPRVELFNLEKVKWKPNKHWLIHRGSLGKAKNYYLGKGFCMRTQDTFLHSRSGRKQRHVPVDSSYQMNITQLRKSRYLA